MSGVYAELYKFKVLVELFQKLVGFQGNALNRTPQSAKLSRLQSAFSLFASFSLPQDEKEKKKVGSGRRAPAGNSVLV